METETDLNSRTNTRSASTLSTLAWAIGSFAVGVGIFVLIASFVLRPSAGTAPIVVPTDTPSSSASAPTTPSPSPSASAETSGARDACMAYAQALGTDISGGVSPLVDAMRNASLQTSDQALRELILAVGDSYASNDLDPETLTSVANYCASVP